MKRKLSILLIVLLVLGSFVPLYAQGKDSPWYGVWDVKFRGIHEKYYMLEKDGTLFASTYYLPSGSPGKQVFSEAFEGTISGNVAQGKMSVTKDLKKHIPCTIILNSDGTINVKYKRGGTSWNHKGTPSSTPMNEGKIKYFPNTAPKPEPKPQPKPQPEPSIPLGTYSFQGPKGKYVLRMKMENGMAKIRLIVQPAGKGDLVELKMEGKLFNSVITAKSGNQTYEILVRADDKVNLTETSLNNGTPTQSPLNVFNKVSGNENMGESAEKIFKDVFGDTLPGKTAKSINGTYILKLDYGNYAIRVNVKDGKGQFKLVYKNDWEGLGEEVGSGTYANNVYETKVKEGLGYRLQLLEDGNVDLIEKVLKNGKPVDQGPFRYTKFNDNDNMNATKEEIYEECFGKNGKPGTKPAKPGSGNAQEVPVTGGSNPQGTKVHNGSTGVSVRIPDEGVIGYRIFRSEVKGQRGISVTDFYITSRSFVDVNVKANTTYYYTLVPVLAEAKPFEGIEEKLGDPIATWTVTTPGNVEDGFTPGQTRHFIVLQIDNPQMTVDGTVQEVDPGRGTRPMVYRNRTMVPIRAIVEALGGEAGWDGNARKVSLTARGNKVEMWIDNKEFIINGKKDEMDVAPMITNSRTFVPLRFAIENLNSKVDWLNSTREVVIAWSE